MRWYKRNVNIHSRNKGDQRCIRRFLLLPRNIDGDVRWLENVWIRQRVIDIDPRSYAQKLKWVDVKWSSEEDEFLDRL